jgi:hypothetical protein
VGRIPFATASLALITAGAVGCSSSSSPSSSASHEIATGEARQALIARPAPRLFLTDPVLARLKARAAANDPAWSTLKTYCDGLSTGTMNPPGGDAYPNFPNVGQGYQGEEYVPPMMALGLCYRTTEGVDATLSAKYGAAGSRLLEAISTPGGQSPSTDSGYGIRNYGYSMAMGFDWLYPVLSASTKSRVIDTLNAWIDWYDQSGFIKNDPIGNYFAGYFVAKVTGALATEGDNPKAAAYFDDIQNRMWGQLVKPEFTRSMAGGGWPEGWEYGPRAVRGMVEALWAVKTARGLDWIHEVPQLRDQALNMSYFAWPSLKHMDDEGTVRSGVNLEPSPSLATSLAQISTYLNEPGAAEAHAFAADVLATVGDDREAWQKFFYWDPSAASSPYSKRQLSYFAKGPNQVAMRSTWTKDATWSAFTSGTYITAGDSGEQMLNQGSISIVRGDQPVIVNAGGWIPQIAGTPGENFVYEDAWGARTRKLYNTFYVADSDLQYNPGQGSQGPNEAATHAERVEDRGVFVRMRGAKIEDMYRPASGAGKPVTQFTRDVVYLRPGTFVLFDRTTVAHASSDQWMAFHTPAAPANVSVSDATQRRYDINVGGGTKGSVRTLLPRGANTKLVDTMGGVTRIETHAPAAGATQDWMHVVTATDATPDLVRLSSADGNVLGGNVVGVHAKTPRQQVVLFAADHAAAAPATGAKYTIQQTGDADHVLVDVAPSASGYGVTVTPGAGGLTVDVHAGGSIQPSAQGTLLFTVSPSGAVSQPAPPTGTPSDPGSTTTPPDPGTTPPPDMSWLIPRSEPFARMATYTVRNHPFLQGLDGYAGTRDLAISAGATDRDGDLGASDGTKSLLRFDLSALPSTARVTGAHLALTVDCSESGRSLHGDFVKTPWTYETADWSRTGGASNWAQPGLGATDVENKPFTMALAASGLQRHTMNLDAQMVQGWVSDPSRNHGVVVTSPGATNLRLVSSEGAIDGERPELIVDYALE